MLCNAASYFVVHATFLWHSKYMENHFGFILPTAGQLFAVKPNRIRRVCESPSSFVLKSSLRADEIKLWLTPSAKQRQIPFLDFQLCTQIWVRATIGQLKKAFVLFVVIANQVEGEFETHFW